MTERTSRYAEFSQFYESHIKAAFSGASRRVGPSLAEDIVAEAFSLAWQRSIASHAFDRGIAWLLTTIFNLCRSELNAAESAQKHREAVGIATHIAAQVRVIEVSPEYDEAWAGLTLEDRELLSSFYHDDLSVADTANALGISEQAARTRLSRAVDSKALT